MASFSRHDAATTLKSVRWPLRLTWAGMCAEAVVRSFWPLAAVVLLVLAALMLGLQDTVAVEAFWAGAVTAAAAMIVTLVRGLRS